MNWIGHMQASLRKPGEAMTLRQLRRTLQELQAIVDPTVSERHDFWLLMSEQFAADPALLEKVQARFTAAMGTPEEASAAVNFRRETVSPRRRLLQRFSAYPGGARFLVDMRAEFQAALKTDAMLARGKIPMGTDVAGLQW